jgi:dTDP-4-amino-4,6-dideoxygalactose transaminase
MWRRSRRIADDYNLKVIYDAAHAFGVQDTNGSVLRHGDLSVLSFHATKVFNTFEGGAIISPDEKTKTRIDQLKNFGHVGETTVVAAGINGKMSEFNAALGLLQLQHIDSAIALRRHIDDAYRAALQHVKGIRCLEKSGEVVSNYAYFPILVQDGYGLSREDLNEALKRRGIYPRRYFFPLISEFPMYRGLPSADKSGLPVASMASTQILCLPIYPDLSLAKVREIAEIIAGYSDTANQ